MFGDVRHSASAGDMPPLHQFSALDELPVALLCLYSERVQLVVVLVVPLNHSGKRLFEEAFALFCILCVVREEVTVSELVWVIQCV